MWLNMWENKMYFVRSLGIITSRNASAFREQIVIKKFDDNRLFFAPRFAASFIAASNGFTTMLG